VIDMHTASLVTPSVDAFEQAIDHRYDAAHSVVLRYRDACRFASPESPDPRLNELLQKTSIREGLRVFPLFVFRGVEMDILDATSLMHTHTHKSIDGCVTTAQCLMRGYERIVFESGGNTGTALTVYGAQAGLETYLFVPTENLPLLDARVFEREAAHVIPVDDPRQVKPRAGAFAEQNGLPRVPQLAWRYQASAFVGCFVLEHLLSHRPYDHLVQSISAAFAPIGVYRALEPHRERLGGLPAFLGVQQAANCPMVRAWSAPASAEAPSVVESTAGLLAKVMYDGAPRTYGTFDELRRILLATGGDLTTIDLDDFREWLAVDVAGKTALEHLADHGVHITQLEGDVVEKAGLMGLVGAMREIASGRMAAGSRVLVCLTGGTGKPRA
jgi:threonine synthase